MGSAGGEGWSGLIGTMRRQVHPIPVRRSSKVLRRRSSA
jgi:hypothetical protein